jgi:hypothetical protein
MQTRDALLDLVFVEDRAYRLTVGRGLGRSTDLLRELAAVGPCRSHGFELLAAQVLEHGRALSGCILVLLDLDAARLQLVRALHGLGVRQLVLAVGGAQQVHAGVPVHGIDPEDIGGSLKQLPESW